MCKNYYISQAKYVQKKSVHNYVPLKVFATIGSYCLPNEKTVWIWILRQVLTFVEVYVNGVNLQVQRQRLLGLSLLLDKSNIII